MDLEVAKRVILAMYDAMRAYPDFIGMIGNYTASDVFCQIMMYLETHSGIENIFYLSSLTGIPAFVIATLVRKCRGLHLFRHGDDIYTMDGLHGKAILEDEQRSNWKR